MSQSLISFMAGIAAVLFVAIFSVVRNSREHSKGERPVRWLDTHPVTNWMRHKH